MASPKKYTDDFYKSHYFEALEEKVGDVKDMVKENTRVTRDGFKELNGRIGKVEKIVFSEHPPSPKITELPPVWNDPIIRRAVYFIALAVLLVAAAVAGADVTGIIGG